MTEGLRIIEEKTPPTTTTTDMKWKNSRDLQRQHRNKPDSVNLLGSTLQKNKINKPKTISQLEKATFYACLLDILCKSCRKEKST